MKDKKSNKKGELDLSIHNLDDEGQKNKYRNKSPLVPQHPFRWIISGGSGCGKTNLLLNFIYRMAEYDKLYLYTKHPQQQKFQDLIQCFIDTGREDDLFVGTSSDEIVPPEDMDSELQSIVVCDDLLLDDQTPIIDMFIRGRHANTSVIYLSQAYFRVPRAIRLQANYFSIFECGRREMLSLYQELGNDLDQTQFFDRCKNAMCYSYSFLHVDKCTKVRKLRYRRGFDHIYDDTSV